MNAARIINFLFFNFVSKLNVSKPQKRNYCVWPWKTLTSSAASRKSHNLKVMSFEEVTTRRWVWWAWTSFSSWSWPGQWQMCTAHVSETTVHKLGHKCDKNKTAKGNKNKTAKIFFKLSKSGHMPWLVNKNNHCFILYLISHTLLMVGDILKSVCKQVCMHMCVYMSTCEFLVLIYFYFFTLWRNSIVKIFSVSC